MMFSTVHNQFKLGIFIAVFGMVLSCLITNCPRGGKRSESIPNSEHFSDCIPCGPENQGVCLGRSICCGKEIGCLTSPRHTKSCRNLTSFKTSCLLGLTMPTCGENGYCRANYLCCTRDRCVMDPACKSMPYIKYKNYNDGLLSVLNPYAQSLLSERNMIGKEEPELNQDEMQKAKSDFAINGSDYES